MSVTIKERQTKWPYLAGKFSDPDGQVESVMESFNVGIKLFCPETIPMYSNSTEL